MSGQSSTPPMFTSASRTPRQSLEPQDASSWTLGSARPTQKSSTLDHRCFASFSRVVTKHCTNFGGTIESVLREDMGLLGQCWALNQRSIAAMNIGVALVWRYRSGTRIWLYIIRRKMDQNPIWLESSSRSVLTSYQNFSEWHIKRGETLWTSTIDYVSELLSKIYQNFYQSDPFSSVVKSGMPLKPRRVNSRMRRTPLYQRSRHRYTNARNTSLPLNQH